jgi:1-deoxy-D-xylulose-5-phosphate synthase
MDEKQAFSLLEGVDDPSELRQLRPQQLRQLSDELRAFILQSVAHTGGHLSSSLGTVELTVALHYVLNTPYDSLVWDVGHQSYGHKILTGRRRAMATLRKKDGLSGFLKRSESKYDSFGAGHSSTSISAALGMAIAAQRRGEDRKTVAVIGDGAMTAGMAFEALNHAGNSEADLLVILNDNEMSISRNVGGISNYLARLLSGRIYSTMREGSKKVLSALPPPMWELARRAEEHVKGMVIPGTLFEELGFNYIGPIDGHDIDTLVATLKNLYSLKGPQFLHVVTRKGKGYHPAEENPCAFHGVNAFNPADGRVVGTGGGRPTYSQIFGEWLCDTAAMDESLVAITPAMCDGSGMNEFAQRFPTRFFDVGIAEQHSVTLAGGLACGGMKPVVAIYSTFLQRAYDQLIHDVALQNLPVLFAIDRAGSGRPRRTDARRQLRPELPALHPEPGCDGAVRRGRVLPDARRRLRLSRTLRGTLPARYRPGTCRAQTGRRPANRPRRTASQGTPRLAARLRQHGAACPGGRRGAGRQRGQHALRQTARRENGPASGRRP